MKIDHTFPAYKLRYFHAVYDDETGVMSCKDCGTEMRYEHESKVPVPQCECSHAEQQRRE